jgi:hypothetical protein
MCIHYLHKNLDEIYVWENRENIIFNDLLFFPFISSDDIRQQCCINLLNIIFKKMSDVNRNLAFDLGQIQQCGSVKSVNRIPTMSPCERY